MKIIAHTNNPTALKSAIDKKINELRTWAIVWNKNNDVLYSHIPEQWNEKSMPMPHIYENRVEFIMTSWIGQISEEATKGYILGRFVEILMVHFRKQFDYLEIN